MGFVIKKIVVHSEPTRVRGGEAHYNMIREKWDVRNLLEVSLRFFVVAVVILDRKTFLNLTPKTRHINLYTLCLCVNNDLR